MPVELSERAQKALRLWEEGCLPHHGRFADKLRQRYRAYRGLLEIRSDAASWTSKLAPPFVGHIVETTLAGLVDDKFLYRVKPKPRFFDPGEYDTVKAGARAHEILHDFQLKQDRFNEKLWPFALQDAIAGLTVAKQYWRKEVSMRPRLEVQMDEQAAAYGVQLPRLVEVEKPDVVFNGPVTEVVNVEDFFWHEAATELQRSPVIAHRCFQHFTDLKQLEADGVYQNVDELSDTRGQAEEYSSRRFVDGTSRSKDMIEVLEIWWKEPDGIYCAVLGNRRVELRAARKNPFWHGEYPFVVCSTRPDLFQIPGQSQVEKIASLQEAHWDLENQTRDNVRLLNNAIFMFNPGVIDAQSMSFEPGARWPVEGNPAESVVPWTPNVIPAQLALPHLGRLEQQMQNLAGSQPFTSTSEANVATGGTATEAALVTNLAQRSTVRLKVQLNLAYARIGQQRTELNKQFLRSPIMVEEIGLDNEGELRTIAPYLLQGDFLFDTEPMNESLMRSEKRAEANAMFQTFLQSAMAWTQLAANGAATPPNFDAFAEMWLDGYDVGDTKRFFSQRQPQQQGQVGQPNPAGQAQPQQAIPNGVTAPQASSPLTSPSAQASLSGETMLHRLHAMKGGVSNT